MQHYYVAVMHSGITLAPAIGAMVVAELLGAHREAALAEFRPDRLERAGKASSHISPSARLG